MSEDKAEEIAARTVNKRRREEGRTPNRRTQGTGNPNLALEERSRDEIYNRARDLQIRGRSKMSKADGGSESATREAAADDNLERVRMAGGGRHRRRGDGAGRGARAAQSRALGDAARARPARSSRVVGLGRHRRRDAARRIRPQLSAAAGEPGRCGPRSPKPSTPSRAWTPSTARWAACSWRATSRSWRAAAALPRGGWRTVQIVATLLDAAQLHALEPSLSPKLLGGLLVAGRQRRQSAPVSGARDRRAARRRAHRDRCRGPRS